ncbi:hypothetical protein HD806DRAFT_304647 [Xylariaceae sp. AK1471]|nr:hypothetical protein HD806DRAFT_304647 [Xylariaceae sp. AK1471]
MLSGKYKQRAVGVRATADLPRRCRSTLRPGPDRCRAQQCAVRQRATFRSDQSHGMLSAKLGGFGLVSFRQEGYRTLRQEPVAARWQDAPECVATARTDHDDALADNIAQANDLYSFGLLCWAMQLRSANPFLSSLLRLTELTPAQRAAMHWATSNHAGRKEDSYISGLLLEKIQALKADASDRLLVVIMKTFSTADSIEVSLASKDLREAILHLYCYHPEARSMPAAMEALGILPREFQDLQGDDSNPDRDTPDWEKGWLASWRPESRIEGFNQYAVIEEADKLRYGCFHVDEPGLRTLYMGLAQFRKQLAEAEEPM